MKKLLAGCLVALSLSACGLPMEGEEGYAPETGSNQQAVLDREIGNNPLGSNTPTLAPLANPQAVIVAPNSWQRADLQKVRKPGDCN